MIENLKINPSSFKAYEENAARIYKETEDKLRGKFDRDRDRILYSKSFRRLSGKTQVFLALRDDHLRNRMTHTIEVSQISTTIAKALGLNETLTEAIALGHDLGHTPFGHVGERTLNYIMSGCDELRSFKCCLDGYEGFKHNWQSIRVVMDLEESKKQYLGLNLTTYTIWGILNHSRRENLECSLKTEDGICMLRSIGKPCNKDASMPLNFYNRYNEVINEKDLTIEALIVELSDEIAQRHHDVEDALEINIISFGELLNKLKLYYSDFLNEDNSSFLMDAQAYRENKDIAVSMLGSFIINLLSWEAINMINIQLGEIEDKYNITCREDFERLKRDKEFCQMLRNTIGFKNNLLERKDKEFKNYICGRILHSHKVQCMDGKGSYVIRELFKAYLDNPQQLPDKTIMKLFNNIERYISENRKEEFDDDMESLREFIEELHERTENVDCLMKIGEIRDILEELNSANNIRYKQVLMRTICDYIAGMTDKYALDIYAELYETHCYI